VIGRALLGKGFEADDTHHEMFWLVINGKKRAIRTRLSHGESEADAWLQSQIGKHMRLPSQQFRDFVECKMDADQHAKRMIELGHIVLRQAA
jgi:hypothetical protein